MKNLENAKELNELEEKAVTGGVMTPHIHHREDRTNDQKDSGVVITSSDGWDGPGLAGVTATWGEPEEGGATGTW